MLAGFVGMTALDVMLICPRGNERRRPTASPARMQTSMRQEVVVKSTVSYTCSPACFSYFISMFFRKFQY